MNPSNEAGAVNEINYPLAPDNPKDHVVKFDDIFIAEPTRSLEQKRYPWPGSVGRHEHGERSLRPSRSFNVALKLVQKLTPGLEWISFFKDTSGLNTLFKFEELTDTLNELFKDQLKSSFSTPQLKLLMEADVVLLCYDKANETILSYGSTRYSRKGDIPGLEWQTSHAGHMVVAKGHERRQLAALTAVSAVLYGHTLTDLFRNEIIVIRTNNKYVEKLFGRVPTIYRSDRLSENETDERLISIVKAMKWTNEQVFHAKEELVMGRPLKITHHFDDEVTIDGLTGDEIIYLARMSSIGVYVVRIVKSVLQRKKRR